MSPLPATSHRRPPRAPVMLGLCLAALLIAACDEEGSYPGSKVLAFKKVTANQSTARIGDTITVNWTYKNGGQLERQRIKLLTLNGQGVSAEEFSIANATRDFSFTFQQPVTVVIVGTDRHRRDMDAAFDVNLDQIYHFRMTGVRSSHPGAYPKLDEKRTDPVFTVQRTRPVFSSAAHDIEFTHFFGIYEVAPEDGVIDAFLPFQDVMPRDASWFARSFDVRENANPPFAFTVGSSFPFLDAGFLSGDGAQFAGQAHADAVAFAGKIAYDGVELRDRKTGLVTRTNVVSYQPIFACVDLRSDAAGTLHVADLHLGNAAQGLVLSTYHGFTDHRFIGTTSVGYALSAMGAVGELSGSVKGGRVGFGVTTRSGRILSSRIEGVESLGVYVEYDAVDWQVPWHPDTNLAGIQ